MANKFTHVAPNEEVLDRQYLLNVDAATTFETTLKTKDTYVAEDIKVQVAVPDATYRIIDAGEVTATASTTDTTYTTETETKYPIELVADAAAAKIQVGVDQAGFADASDVIDVAAAEAQGTKTIYIKEGTLVGDGEASAEGNIQITAAAAQPATGFYIKASAAGSVGVGTAGWVDPDDTEAVATDAEKFYTVKAATLSNSEANAEDYELKTAPVLTEDGFLFINEGYIGDTKISLATLVPDDANITSENADMVYNTVKAYDVDGKLIVGTMGDAELGEITADDAAAVVQTVAVAANDEGTAFKVSGSKAIAGTASVAVSKRGLAETDLAQTGVISGTATVDAEIAKIGLAINVEANDVEVTPVIAKEEATNVVSGDITTTAPATGAHYVAISTAAIEQKAVVSPIVATEGYGTADVFNATGAEVKAGAAASGTYYVTIQEAEHAIVKGESEIGAPVTTVTTAVDGGDVTPVVYAEGGKVEGQKYIRIDAAATTADGYVQTSAKCTSTEGYILATDKDIVTKETVEVADAAATAKFIRVFDGSFVS